MYEKGQSRLTRAQARSHEKTASGLPQSSSHRSSLSASGALMSTHRAIIQASYRTLRPSSHSRCPTVAASGQTLQSAPAVPKKSPSLCMPGHPSRSAFRSSSFRASFPTGAMFKRLASTCQLGFEAYASFSNAEIFQGATICHIIASMAHGLHLSQWQHSHMAKASIAAGRLQHPIPQ